MKKLIWFKNWMGEWEKSSLPATKANLEIVKKQFALNGQAEIFKKIGNEHTKNIFSITTNYNKSGY